MASLTQDLEPNELFKFFENFNYQPLEAPSAINDNLFITFTVFNKDSTCFCLLRTFPPMPLWPQTSLRIAWVNVTLKHSEMV